MGTHAGHLWSSTGTLLSSATFSNETASGWQQVNLPSPVTLTPGISYIVSYHTNGFYSADSNFFATALTNGPLTAPATSAAAGNGVYAYGTSGSFPASSYNASNYWVDVSFLPAAAATQAPAPLIDAKAFGDQGTPSAVAMTSAFSTTSANELLLDQECSGPRDCAAPGPRWCGQHQTGYLLGLHRSGRAADQSFYIRDPCHSKSAAKALMADRSAA
jgi:hypothetical protein